MSERRLPGWDLGGGEPTPLEECVDRLWSQFSDPSSLLADLPADAVLARSSAGEFRFCLPRLLELVLTGQMGEVEAFVVADQLQVEGWTSWVASERETLESFFDTWWYMARNLDTPAGHLMVVNEVLGFLIHLGVPLVRWLGPWLEDFDGPAAKYFADLVLSDFAGPAWDTAADERGQVEGWAASEATVMGIALVGGIHLEEGQLSEVLDRLV